MTEKRVVVNISKEADDAKFDGALKQLSESGGLRKEDLAGTRDGNFTKPLVLTVEGIQERRRLVKVMDFLAAKGNIASVLDFDSLPPGEREPYVRYLEDLATQPGKGRYTLKNPRAFISHLRETLISGGITQAELGRIDTTIASSWGEKVIKGDGLGTGEIEFGPAVVVDVKDVPVPERTIDGSEVEYLAEVNRLIAKTVEACTRAYANRIRLPKDVDTSGLDPMWVAKINEVGLANIEGELAIPDEGARKRIMTEVAKIRRDADRIREEGISGIVTDVVKSVDQKRVGDNVRFLLENQIPENATPEVREERLKERGDKVRPIFFDILDDVSTRVNTIIYGCEPSYQEMQATVGATVINDAATETTIRICDPDHPCAEWAAKQVFEGKLAKMPPRFYGFVEGGRDCFMEALTGTSKGRMLLHTLENVKFSSVIVGDSFESILNTETCEGRLAGVVEGIGAELSHFSISMKKARVPTVLRIGKIVGEIRTGELVVVDDHDGVCILNPTPKTLSDVIEKRERLKARAVEERSVHLPAAIKEGPTVGLMANITREEDLATRIIGLAEYKGKTYSFSTSNVRDSVRIESPDEQTGILCNIRINEPIPQEIKGADREFVEWVKSINVDNEGNARRQARHIGVEIQSWKRHTGATGMGAEGVGLFRTEHVVERTSFEMEAEHTELTAELVSKKLGILFKDEFRNTIDTYESESRRNAKKFAARVSDRPEHTDHMKANIKKPIVFRIPDYGRDKELPKILEPLVEGYEKNEERRNTGAWPGGINFALQNSSIFVEPFLKAIMEAKQELRSRGAEHDHEIHVMLPMTMSPLDVRDMIAAMKRVGIKHSDGIRIIPLLEKPETAVESTTEGIIKMGVDGEGNQWITSLCIGSNDMTTFATGAERTKVKAKALDGLLLRPISSIAATARKHNIPVGLCGEAGGDGINALTYARLGLGYISMDGGSIPDVKITLRKTTSFEKLLTPDKIVQAATENPDSLRKHMESRVNV